MTRRSQWCGCCLSLGALQASVARGPTQGLAYSVRVPQGCWLQQRGEQPLCGKVCCISETKSIAMQMLNMH